MKAIQRRAWRMVVSLCLLGMFSAEAGSQPGVVVAWGYNGYGQTNVPPGLSNMVAIAAGGDDSLALQSNGTVVAWGDNSFGQTNVPVGLSNVVAIAGGEVLSLALQRNGMVVAWGAYPAPAGVSNVVAIAGGGYHSLALQSNGTVVAWGDETNAPPGLSNVVAIAGGGYHSLALQSNGTVVAWGDNNSGQTTVPPGLNGVVAIAGGGDFSLALQSSGTVVAWGNNVFGQTNVPPGLSNVVAISGGGSHSLAITLGPVIFSIPPTPMSLALDAGTNLSVAVLSGSPFGCQWSLNGLPIAGATGTNLVISNFDFTKAGAYSFVVTNQYGYATVATVLRLTNSPVILVDGVDLGGGTVGRTNTSQITMSSTFGSGAHIYYTLDESAPSYLSIPYQGPFQLGTTATIRALAYDSAYLSSAEAAPITVQISPIYSLILKAAVEVHPLGHRTV